MDMKVDAQRIRSERARRAWSQEHLATITGLGLRTVQRIESTGSASHESIAAIASVLAIPVDQLIAAEAFKPTLLADRLLARRLWILSPCALAALLLAPPELNTQVSILLGLWVGFEIVIAALRRRGVRA